MAAHGLLGLTVGSSQLHAVPALHHHADFALTVNWACGVPALRPQAVAVELGPATVAAASHWFRELGVGPMNRNRLPCLLGLVKENHCLRPSFKERAVSLELETGRSLHELPPALVFEELGTAGSSITAMSPVDSIIEAIRCACELEVPVYGVDLEDTALPRYGRSVLPDPERRDPAWQGLLRRIASGARSDPEVDPRREYAMAARLKGLLARHGRVLFTGGMAHWARIEKLLAAADVRGSVKGLDSPEAEGVDRLRRTLIAPEVAVCFLDALPAVAELFERRRQHPLLDPPRRNPPRIDRAGWLRRTLQKTCREHFSASAAEPWGFGRTRDWEAIRDFVQLVRAQGVLRLRQQPTLDVVAACARATLSQELQDSLWQAFTSVPWAQRESFPRCAYLRSARGEERKQGRLVLQEPGTEEGIPQPISLFPGGDFGLDVPAELPTPKSAVPPEFQRFGYRFTWRPWEHLLNGLCGAVLAQTFGRRREPRAELFAGELLGGIDLRATLRAQCRGQDQLWVRGERLRHREVVPDLPEGFPIVWIFDSDDGIEKPLRWSTYFEPVEWLERAADDPAAFRRLLPKPGDGLVDLITCAREGSTAAPELARRGIGCEVLVGLIVFSPIFQVYRQAAKWFQRTAARKNPVSWCWRNGGGEALVRELSGRSGVDFGKANWQHLMIAAALPFAHREIVVVAPPGFTLPGSLRHRAAGMGKGIRLVSSQGLRNDLVARLTRYYSVPGRLDQHGRTEYAPEAERLIGETLDRYRDLVPASWRRFGLEG